MCLQDGGLGGLKYPLLADFNKTISRDYGVLVEDAGVALRYVDTCAVYIKTCVASTGVKWLRGLGDCGSGYSRCDSGECHGISCNHVYQ